MVATAGKTEMKKELAKAGPVEDTILHGMDAICAVARRSEPTVLRWVRDLDFPAAKVDGVWVADREQIQEWYRNRIARRTGKRAA